MSIAVASAKKKPELYPFKKDMVGTRPHFKWSAVSEAVSYHFVIKNVATGECSFTYDLTKPEHKPGRALPPGEYVWYAKAVYEDGDVIPSKAGKVQVCSTLALGFARWSLGRKQRQGPVREQDYLARVAKGEALNIRTMCLCLGHQCNISCIICPSGRKADARKLPVELLDSAEQWLGNCERMILGGGEPLVYAKEVKRFVDRSREIGGSKIALHSNGCLIDKEWVKYLCAGGVERIGFSIDGAEKETYESIRVGASFDKVRRALDLLADQGDQAPERSMTMVVMKRNMAQMENYVRMAAEAGVSEVVFQILRTQLVPSLNSESPLFDPSCMPSLLNNLENAEELCRQYGIRLVDKLRPMIFNVYPDLISSPQDLAYLPTGFLEFGVSEQIDQRVNEMFMQYPPDRNAPRYIPDIDPEAFAASRKPFFCKVPFENLNLDSSWSFLCCGANNEYCHQEYERHWTTVTDVWNSSFLESCRKDMKAGLGATKICHANCAWYHKGGYDENRDGYIFV